MKLLVERPNEPGVLLPWNIYTQGRFELNKDDVERLESGCSLRIGSPIGGTILSLQEEEHV